MPDPLSRNATFWFFLGLFLLSCFLLGWLLWPFASILVMGMVISGMFTPVYARLNRRLSPSLASFTTCLLVFLVLFVPILFFVGILSGEAYDLYLTARGAALGDQVKDLLQGSRLFELVNRYLAFSGFQLTGESFNRGISELGRIIGLFLYQQASEIATNILAFLANFFFMLLVVFYLLMDGPRLVSVIVDLSPLPRDQDEILIRKFRDMAGAILIGNGLSGLIQGGLGGALFAVFGLTSPFLWGVIMGLLAFLPIVGIGVVLVPAAVYLFLSGRVGAGVFFIVFYVVISGCIEYIFKPKLVGKRVQMHTLLVFLAIIGGLKLFGILGIIYGPLVVTAFLTLRDIYHASYRRLVSPEGE